jgi:2-octaprenyl-6-methoxyphenol hydroxylase
MARKATGYTAEVAVVGGGPAGLIAAVALAAAGAETVLIAPAPGSDRRTTALLDGSVKALKVLSVWDALAPRASALKVLRLVDATRRLIRAPEVTFNCAELRLEAFGYNIENEALRDGLLTAASAAKRLRMVKAVVADLAPDDSGVTLCSTAGDERVRLVVAADGRDSFCRKAAGIVTRGHKLGQSALALTLRHSRPHDNVSTEFHTESGPFTLVPLPGRRSSLVWVAHDYDAEAFAALDDVGLGEEVERRAHSILGKMEVEAGRGVFPLAAAIAERFAARRIVLVGEAGHVLPPIGAQGLNLSIRDAALVAELVADARRDGVDVGDVCADYDLRRRGDVRSRAMAVEMFGRSLLTNFLPVHALRGLGLALAANVGPMRRLLMREGLGERAGAPRLVRGEAL